jgi:DNA-binding NarL/FixJ family response regulator
LLVEAAQRGIARAYIGRIVDVIGTPPGFRGEPVDCPVPSDPVTRDEKGQAETLSDRELEVLRLLARGASNQEIADDLVITVGTVKSHINHIAVKLDVHNRTAAVARGRELGLLRI